MRSASRSLPRRLTDDLPRHRFSVADVERMIESGVMREDDRIELIHGDLIEMSPKGNRHEAIKAMLLRRWYRAAPDDIDLIPETTLRLGPDTFLEPDVCIFPRQIGVDGLDGASVLLVVEIAHTTLGYDLGVKAPLYATYGVRELWVIDAATGWIHVHRTPESAGYGSISIASPDETLVPAFDIRADFALRLADFGLPFDRQV